MSEQPESTRFFEPTHAPVAAVLTVAAIAVFVADLAKKDTSPPTPRERSTRTVGPTR